MRDYEIKEDLGPSGHLILSIDEGDEEAGRPPAALYTNLARFNILRRRRVRVRKISLSHVAILRLTFVIGVGVQNADEIRDYGNEDTFFDGYQIIVGSQTESGFFTAWKKTRAMIAAEIGEPGLADAEGEADADGEGEEEVEAEAMDEGGSDA